ncbi:MAG TPA: hypothetical protein VKX49_04615 [Bryobacteraceae bacterium]|nr:hypothetical protein [Bryobacteraceae bacterium]
MFRDTGKLSTLILTGLGLALFVFSSHGFASDHHALNGTWRLVPSRSEFAGEPMMQTGTLTISDREHNIYIAKNYNYDGRNVTVNYQTSLDGRETSTIHEGKAVKTKAKWEGEELQVTTKENHEVASVERYRLNPDGTLTVISERAGHPAVTLTFERQP